LVVSGERAASDVTSITGEFSLDYVPSGRYTLEARSQRLGEGALIELDIREGETDLDITMQPWASVRGSVRDAEGNAIAGLALQLAEQVEPRGRGSVSTGEDGSFEIRAVRSGSLALFAGGLRVMRAGEREPTDRIEFVHDDARATQLELVAEARSGRVRVQIVDINGEPLAGLRLGLVREHELGGLGHTVGVRTTDLDGKVNFEGVPDGPLSLRWPDGSVEPLERGVDVVVRD
jgi:hypothetical protein